jgi:hypothetical protein
MSTIIYDEPEVEVIEEEAETVEEVEDATGEDEKPYQEILSLPKEEIDRILAEEQARPKLPPDPCLFEDSSEDLDEEPISEYQDSMEAAGYPYW